MDETALQLKTLGGFGLSEASGRAVPLQPKRLLLLTYLLVEGPTPRSTLIQLFYRGNNGAFNTNLHHLKREGLVLAGPREVRASPAIRFDVDELRRALEQEEADAVQAIYRGPFLEGLEFRDWRKGSGLELEEWVLAQRDDLERALRSFQLKLAETYAAKGLPEQARSLAERALRLESLQLPAPQELLRFYRLLHETGSPLAGELKEELPPEQLAASVPAKATRLTGLVKPPDPNFVGRQAELAALQRALTQGKKVVRLTGRSGVGKTRLLTELMHRLAATRHYHAICYLQLSDDPTYRYGLEDIAQLLFATLPAPERERVERAWQEARLTQQLLLLRETFAERPCLLVLDHFDNALLENGRLPYDLEQVLAFVLEFDTPLQLLVTSPYPLPLPAALLAKSASVLALHHLSGLPSGEAVTLLRSLDPDNGLGLKGQPTAVLEKLVAPLYGVPRFLQALVGTLQLSPTLSVAELLAEPQRVHAISEAEAQRRYEALEPQEQRLLEALSLFKHPVPSQILDALLPEVSARPLLDALIMRHLVKHHQGDGGAEQLVCLFPPERAYLAKRLSGKQKQLLHLRAAAYFRQQHPPEHERHAAEDLYTLRQEFHHLLEADCVYQATRLLLAIGKCDLLRLGMAGTAFQMASLLVPQLQAGHERSQVLNLMSLACTHMGDVEQAKWHFQEALRLSEAAGDKAGQALCLSNYALYLSRLGQSAEALEAQRAALALERQLGNAEGEALSLGFLGLHHYEAGNLEQAERYLGEALELSSAQGDRRHEGIWWGTLSLVYARRQQREHALRAARRALALHFGEPLSREAEASALDNLGKLYHAEGNDLMALALWVAAFRLHHREAYREDLRARLLELQRSWPGYAAALEQLEETGDALLQKASRQAYQLFSDLDLSEVPGYGRSQTVGG